MARLYIYVMPGCSACSSRIDYHNILADTLETVSVEVVGVQIGIIGENTHLPLADHDFLCKNPNDTQRYMTPTYILEYRDSVLKLSDPSSIGDSSKYAEYILNILQQIENGHLQ